MNNKRCCPTHPRLASFGASPLGLPHALTRLRSTASWRSAKGGRSGLYFLNFATERHGVTVTVYPVKTLLVEGGITVTVGITPLRVALVASLHIDKGTPNRVSPARAGALGTKGWSKKEHLPLSYTWQFRFILDDDRFAARSITASPRLRVRRLCTTARMRRATTVRRVGPDGSSSREIELRDSGNSP